MLKPKAIAITQGDSAGIGPEIVAKAFRDAPEVLQGCFAVGESELAQVFGHLGNGRMLYAAKV